MKPRSAGYVRRWTQIPYAMRTTAILFLVRITLLAVGLVASSYSFAQPVPCADIATDKIAASEELLDLLGYRPTISSVTDSVLHRLVLDLGEGDPSWSSGHPRWKGIADRVLSDLSGAEIAAEVAVANALRPTARCVYARTLDQGQLDEFLNYLKSDIGKRHLQFGAELKLALAKLLDRLISERQNTGSISPIQKSSFVVQARLDMIQSSLWIGTMQSAGQAIKRNGGDSSGYWVIGSIYADIVSRDTDGQLDALVTTYANELAGFRDFNRSSLMEKQGEAWAALSSTSLFSAAQMQFLEVYGTALMKLQIEWKQIYREAVVSNPPLQGTLRDEAAQSP